MKGTKNAMVLQGGEGGETVYAVNNTGTAIVRGTKAWLNRHIWTRIRRISIMRAEAARSMRRFLTPTTISGW